MLNEDQPPAALASTTWSDAGALELERIIGCEIVDSDHALAAFKQRSRDMHPDEASCAGDEYRQIPSPRLPPTYE